MGVDNELSANRKALKPMTSYQILIQILRENEDKQWKATDTVQELCKTAEHASVYVDSNNMLYNLLR